MSIKYKVEIQRTNITPRAFWNYCRREIERRTGGRASLTDWVEDYDSWKEPLVPSYSKSKHEDWDEPLREVSKIMPYDFQYYLENSYNFIMEFNFWDDKTGNGYLWLVE